MSYENNVQETIKQFHLDVPRMDIYIDEILCEKDSELVEEQLKNKFKENINLVMHILTQTFLADFYINEFKKKIKTEESLLDNGNYIVKIYSCEKTINIEKDFKLMHFDEDDSYYLLNFCTLDITVYLDNMNIIYTWIYDNDKEETNIEIINI